VRIAAVLLTLIVGQAGCGTVDDAVDDVRREADKRIAQVKEKSEELRREAQRLRDRVSDRVNEVLADLEGVVPQADEATVIPRRVAASSFEGFMNDVFVNVDGYWKETFAAADIARPRVGRVFIRPSETVDTDCGEDADDQSAFYCPADDTIYVGESISRDILDNLGDFGVAYVIAHEYAHNVQQELGWFDAGFKLTTVAPFELQAELELFHHIDDSAWPDVNAFVVNGEGGERGRVGRVALQRADDRLQVLRHENGLAARERDPGPHARGLYARGSKIAPCAREAS